MRPLGTAAAPSQKPHLWSTETTTTEMYLAARSVPATHAWRHACRAAHVARKERHSLGSSRHRARDQTPDHKLAPQGCQPVSSLRRGICTPAGAIAATWWSTQHPFNTRRTASDALRTLRVAPHRRATRQASMSTEAPFVSAPVSPLTSITTWRFPCSQIGHGERAPRRHRYRRRGTRAQKRSRHRQCGRWRGERRARWGSLSSWHVNDRSSRRSPAPPDRLTRLGASGRRINVRRRSPTCLVVGN